MAKIEGISFAVYSLFYFKFWVLYVILYARPLV
jgi:hypothetical protein